MKRYLLLTDNSYLLHYSITPFLMRSWARCWMPFLLE